MPDELPRKIRELAAECLAVAQHITDINIRASLLGMAQRWLERAELRTHQTDEADFQAIQMEIGKELRLLYDLPEEIPYRILVLLMQLNEQQDGRSGATVDTQSRST